MVNPPSETETALPMVLPDDLHDRQLVDNCHPKDWTNPTPAPKYNLVVLGAGTAGLVCAAGAAGLGARVALVEEALLGGDCLNVGCVPSKGVLRAARALFDVTQSREFGVRLNGTPTLDFAEAMERMRSLRAGISVNDSVHRFKALGVDVFLGRGRFTGPATLEVDGMQLLFRRGVIATGGRPAAPPVPGLKEAGYYTNETIFTLRRLPRRLAVIGAGPIGCELAQAFSRCGSVVHVITDGARILPREDPDAAATVEQQMAAEGITFHFQSLLLRVVRQEEHTRVLVSGDGTKRELLCDAILVAVGRTPALDGIGLESAGVRYSAAGVEVNDRLRTTNPRIYAAGDVCSRFKFTHAADAMARIVLANALFFGRRKASALVIPWCTYTDPEIAHVGYYEEDARRAGFDVGTMTQEFKDIDRAVLDGETRGFARVHYDRQSGRILGGTIVGRHAGETIGELVLAVETRQKMSTLARTIHPYPTQAEALKRVGDGYVRGKLTPRLQFFLGKWFKWQR